MERFDDYEKDFVEGHLLAYIGNKRRLLPLLLRGISEAQERLEAKGFSSPRRLGLFVDYFSGTGVVSRLARSLGYRVVANDWEDYAYVMGRAFLEVDCADGLFAKEGGLARVLRRLNGLTSYRARNAYISTYYCPRSDADADASKERMFYTRANGVLIDNIRSAIDEWFPASPCKQRAKQRDLLLGLLLHEASKRSNTSGVFKGFHNGFGGRKRDALNRILASVSLKAPVLSAQKHRCKMFRADALKLARRMSPVRADIAYLDPPYNQHQYGSNYHLLNTIARNDRPSLRRGFWVDGKKVQKSGIRRDWVNTKSTFCVRQEAERDFQRLVNNINAHMLLVSYSTEGVIPFDAMVRILSSKGKLGIITTPYTRYRGGRQSNTTKNSNVEFVLMVDANEPSTPKDLANVKGVLVRSRFSNLLSETFPFYKSMPEQFSCSWSNGQATVFLKPLGLEAFLTPKLRLDPKLLDQISERTYAEQELVYKSLQAMFQATNSDEVVGLASYLRRYPNSPERKFLLERLFRLYTKIHPTKNAASFRSATKSVERLLPVLDEENEIPWALQKVGRGFGAENPLASALQSRLKATATAA